MGWTGTGRQNGQSDLAYFRQEFRHGVHTPGHGTFEVLAAATKNGTCYMACRRTPEGGPPGPVFAVVALIHRQGPGRIFTYKDIEETCGPCEAECPERIMALLDPLPDCGHPVATSCGICWARDWRSRCQARLTARRTSPRVRVGQTFRLRYALRFADGQILDTFTLVSHPRRRNLARSMGGGLYRLPADWRGQVAEVL
jgi:hypothetical protein